MPFALVSLPDRVVRITNPAARRFFAIPDPVTLIGRPLDRVPHNWHMIEADGTPVAWEETSLARALSGETVHNRQVGFILPDGTVRWALVNAAALRDADGTPVAAFTVLIDITELQRTRNALENTLHDQNRMLAILRSALESTAEGILSVDTDGRITGWNQPFIDIWGLPDSIMAGVSDRATLDHVRDQLADPQAFLERVAWYYAHPEAEGSDLIALKDGRTIERATQPQRIGNQISGRLWRFRDVTERRRNEEALRRLAYYDPLTGLPNRTLLEDRFNQACARARRDATGFALMFMDLDDFKHINDTHGHHIGDRLLCAVAERLEGLLRQTDTVARRGGDEFLVLITDMNDRDAPARVAETVRDGLRAPFRLDGRELYVSASIGIALYPDHGTGLQTLSERADAAMYLAKADGPGHFGIAADLPAPDASRSCTLKG